MIPAKHEHVISEVTGLQSALNGKAAASHTHSAISSAKVAITLYEDNVVISVTDSSGNNHDVTIDATNIENLDRALNTPSFSPEGGPIGVNKLITSKAVFDALADKAGAQNLKDLALLVLTLAEIAEVDENLSWTIVDSNCTLYSITSLVVSDYSVYNTNDIYKISDGTHKAYSKATSFDATHNAIGFNYAFTGWTSGSITISKLLATGSSGTELTPPNTGSQEEQELGDVGDIEPNPAVGEGGGK